MAAARHATRWGRAQPVTIDGHRFPSKAEARWYGILKLREVAGEIRDLTLQPKFPLVINGRPVLSLGTSKRRGSPLSYRADFAFSEGGRRRVIEVKGIDDPTSRLRRAIVQHIHDIEIEVVK